MVRLRADGLTRQIGVSNFYEGHLDRLAAVSDVRPFANQAFIDATHHEDELLRRLAADGIRPMAYRPLAFLPVVAMAAEMGDGTAAALEAQAAACGAASSAQLVLAWLARRGIVAVTATRDPAHLKANLAAAALAPGAPDTLGGEAADGNEMVAMCGGHDEFAAAFKAAGAALRG